MSGTVYRGMKALAILTMVFLLIAWQWHPIKVIPTTCERFEVDELHNIYLIYDDHLEIVRQQQGDVWRTSNLDYGSSFQLDVSNPLKPFLYYPLQGLMINFDNSLSPNGAEVRLPEMGYEQIEWVCGSQGDHYWMWDGLQSEMLRVDQQYRIKNRSGNLAARLGRFIVPERIQEEEDAVYIFTKEGTVIQLDLFGGYQQIYTRPIAEDRRVEGQYFIERIDYEVYQFDLRTGSLDSLQLPPSASLHFQWSGGLVYQCDGKQLIQYQLSIP